MLLTSPLPPSPPSVPPSPTTTTTHYSHLLSLLNQCSSMSDLKQIHAQTLRTSSSHHPKDLLMIQSRLLHFTASSNHLDYSFKLFSQIHSPNSFMWNTLIRACATSSDPAQKALAFVLYRELLVDGGVEPDKHTFPFVLKACAYLFDEVGGKQVHGHVVKLGFGLDVYVNNSLMHFYGSCGRLGCARLVFDEMQERSVVSWNVMIDGLVRLGEFDVALGLFRRMQESMIEPDGYTMQSIVSACASLGALSLGMWIHAYIHKVYNGNLSDVLLNNSLIEMYSKCGMLDLAKQVFDGMVKRDVNSYNAMILGCAMHGKAELAMEHFNEMTSVRGLRPNSITFVGVLSACNHRGMVEMGRMLFDKMVKNYSIEPQLEHYGCLVDLLARAGLLEEALDLVQTMPMKPDVIIWRSLLDACCKNNTDIQLSEEVANMIIESGGETSSGVYVLLSRVYASAARWDDVGLIRKLMSDSGIMKEPGCSSLELNGVHHEFFAGDTSHPHSKDIYRVLGLINQRLSAVGYKPDLSQAPLVNDEDEGLKENALRLHSERLAIAFGLLHSKPGVPIRVFKNLRVCNDCHEVTKLVSKMFNVQIIVRDRTRFHHFKDGCCSCSDYW